MTNITTSKTKGVSGVSELGQVEEGLNQYITPVFSYFVQGVPRIITFKNPLEFRVLRQVSKQVAPGDIKGALAVAKMLQKSLTSAPQQVGVEGVGLSAVQIGLLAQVFIAIIGGEIKTFINPILRPLTKEKTAMIEGCLSLPDVEVIVPRYTKVQVEYYNLEGKKVREVFKGYNARVIQHEYDHLYGRLILDYRR